MNSRRESIYDEYESDSDYETELDENESDSDELQSIHDEYHASSTAEKSVSSSTEPDSDATYDENETEEEDDDYRPAKRQKADPEEKAVLPDFPEMNTYNFGNPYACRFCGWFGSAQCTCENDYLDYSDDEDEVNPKDD